MCSNPEVPYLIGFHKTDKQALVVRANCDKWECVECAERKRTQWVARAILGSQEIISSGMDLQFLTITCHRKLGSFAATLAIFPNAWALLYARMKRKQKSIRYLMIMEQHRNGRLHAHMLTDLKVTTRWLKDSCAYSGMGYQAKVERVENEGKAAAYTSKYIGKSLGGTSLPHKFRRVRTSQTWAALPDIMGQRSDYNWMVCNTTTALWACTEQCQQEKRVMIVGDTGEYFDYQDTVEHWY